MDEKDVNNDIANWFMHTEALKYSESINLNISSMPPLHLIHYTLGDVHYLGIAIHYAIYDAVTLPKILCDIELSYSEGVPNPSASLLQVLELVHGTSQEKAVEYWRGQFTRYDWKKSVNRFTPGQEAIFLDVPFAATLAELEAEASKAHVSLQVLLTCAYTASLAKNLYKYKGVTFGVSIHYW